MEKRHLLLCGERGVGKSTLIRRLLALSTRPLGGFVTLRRRTPDEKGFYPIYLYDAALPESERRSTAENLAGICDSHSSVRHSEVFDTLGTRYIKAAPENGLILMDELGFLENEAHVFRRAVLDALDGETPVLAAVKPKDTDFLRAVRGHGNAALVFIGRENRDALYEELAPRILAWNDFRA